MHNRIGLAAGAAANLISLSHAMRVTAGAVVLASVASPAVAATGEMATLIRDIGVGIFLSGLLAIVLARFRIPAIAGYILAGVIAGPLGLKIVTDPTNIETISQLGFVLLLFVIGLEIDVSKILRSGRTIVLTGLLQFPLIILFGFAYAKLMAAAGFGAILGDNLGAVYVGVIISFSSTLLVVKLFQEAFDLDTTPGRVALGLLVIEDLWAIAVIVVQPSFRSPELMPIVWSFVGIGVLSGVAFLFARTVIPIAFRWIAKVPEIILVGAISWCFMVIFLGSAIEPIGKEFLGLELSLNVGSGMGALIAGATIASLPYSTEIANRVNVVRDFFVTLFFVGLGLSIPLPSGPMVLLALLIALAAIAARQLILFPLLYINGLDQRNAEVTALRMAQISEFSLVIAYLGLNLGHLTRDLQSAIVIAFVLTALFTPSLYHAAYRIHSRLAPVLASLGFRTPTEAADAEEAEWQLAILGFHRVASSLLYNIARDDPALVQKTLVVDYNVTLHARIHEFGATVKYGDLADFETLHHAGVDRARVVVLTIPDELLRGTTNALLVAAVRKMNPTATIIANATSFADSETVYAQGADYVFLPRLEVARMLSTAIGSALKGDIWSYRMGREAGDGKLGERTEPLP